MPQTDFFAADDDEMRLLEFIFQNRLRIIPDLRYESSSVTFIENWHQYQKVRLETQLFYVVSNEEVLSPLGTARVPGTDKYCVVQRNGGPALTFLCYQPYEKDGAKWILASMVSYYVSYKNTSSGEFERTPTRLRFTRQRPN